MESGSDDERQEDRQSNHNDTDNDDSWEDYRRPTNNRTKEFSKHDRTPKGGSNQDRDTSTASVITPTKPKVNLEHGSLVNMTKAKPYTSDTRLALVKPSTPVKDSPFTDQIQSRGGRRRYEGFAKIKDRHSFASRGRGRHARFLELKNGRLGSRGWGRHGGFLKVENGRLAS